MCMCIMMHDIQTKKGISGYGLKSKGPSVDINKLCTAYENEVYLIYILILHCFIILVTM